MTDEEEYRYIVECQFLAACCKHKSLYRHIRVMGEKYVLARGDIMAEFLRNALGKEPSMEEIAREVAVTEFQNKSFSVYPGGVGTQEYRDNWDRIFAKKKDEPQEEPVPDTVPELCNECGEPLNGYGPDWCQIHFSPSDP